MLLTNNTTRLVEFELPSKYSWPVIIITPAGGIATIPDDAYYELKTFILDLGLTVSFGVAGVAGPINNYGATVAPTINDDSTAGYTIGSHWVDTLTDTSYILVDATPGAAVWDTTTGAGSSPSALYDIISIIATTPAATPITAPTVALGVSAAIFNGSTVTVLVNGIEQIKGVDALWVSATQISLSIPLYAGDVVTIKP